DCRRPWPLPRSTAGVCRAAWSDHAALQRAARARDPHRPGSTGELRAVTTCRVRSRERGQAMAEMAIVAPLFILLLFGIIEFGRAWMISNMITHAARDGARAAAVLQNRGTGGTITDTSSIVAHVNDAIASVTSANLNVQVTQTTISGNIPVVQIH